MVDDLGLDQPFRVDWDAGNASKNWQRREVTAAEAESVFRHRIVIADAVASRGREMRRVVIGWSEHERVLTVVFTVRQRRVRVISARPASRKERDLYAKADS